MEPQPASRQLINEIFRKESQRVFATLVRLLRDFDLAEEALQEAFTAAIEQWAVVGVPANPRAWLVSAGRFKAIDHVRKQGRLDVAKYDIATRYESLARSTDPHADEEIEDDRLRLIFTCCHPAIAQNVQVALTLREVCGLTTDEIAHAFLVPTATMAQRLVRGKAKIRDAGIPVIIPATDEIVERLESVLMVIYLVFNEGYSASTGDSTTRADLSNEAIRLGRMIVELFPDPEAIGLLALMLLQESRRLARSTSAGDLILLEDQDRSLWNQQMITEGRTLIQRSLATRNFGPYAVQAAIAAEHATAANPSATDWTRIVALYDTLHSMNPSPVVELNRAVAIAMRDGPNVGLALVDGILDRGDLTEYHLAHAARADLCRRLGQTALARESYLQAIALAKQGPEQRFLRQRLENL